MASSQQSASCVLFVDNVQIGTLKNRVPISLTIPSVAVHVPVLPIFSEDDGFLTLEVAQGQTVKQNQLGTSKICVRIYRWLVQRTVKNGVALIISMIVKLFP